MKTQIISLLFLTVLIFSCKANNIKQGYLVQKKPVDQSAPASESTYLKKMRKIEIPQKIKNLIKEEVYLAYTVDFTGDGVLDFICRVEVIDATDNPIKEYWISSDLNILKEQRGYPDSRILGFLNIDKDPELEYIRINGEETEVDLVMCDQKNWKEKELFYLYPIIQFDGAYYWGFPHLIEDIMYKQQDSTVLFEYTLNHAIVVDDREQILPVWQRRMPALIFKGNQAGNFEIKDLRNLQFIRIEELRSLVVNYYS